MQPPFVPSPLLLALVLGLAALASFVSALPGGGLLVLAAALLLLAGFLAEGLGRSPRASVVLVRELPRALSVGESARVQLRVRNLSAAPLRLRIADGCPPALAPRAEFLDVELAPFQETTAHYEVEPLYRGAFPFGPLDARIRRPRGLAEHQLRLLLPAEARVHPNLRNLARYDLRARRDLLQQGGARRTRILGRDGDFERLRDFVAGDDLRHVDWKATARARRPITRVYQAERSQNLVILVDATRLMGARAQGLAKMDFAVNAALMLTWVGLLRGDRVGVGVFDDGLRSWAAPQSGHPQFGRVLDLLFDEQPALRFPRYREVARQIVRQQRRRSLLVWLTDLLDGEQGRELLLALRALRGRHLSLVVAVDDPEVHELAAAEPRDPAQLFTRVAAAEILDEREALIRRLHSEGAVVLDRRPDEITAALVDRYLDIKQSGAL